MAVVLSELLQESHVTMDLRARIRDEALREVVLGMDQEQKIADRDALVEAIIQREKAASTYASHGVAFPHARTTLVNDIVLGIGRSVDGVPFSPEGALAHLIFVVAVPTRMVTDYLVCIGALARLMKDEEMRTTLLAASSAAEIVEQLREASLLLK